MRFWISGPRIGVFRPGISFGSSFASYRPAAARAAVPAGQFVYVISGEHGAVKIGISSNPTARRAELQTGSPHGLFLESAMWAGENAFEIEQEAHAILASYRMPGEWFHVSREAALAAVCGAAARLGLPLGDAPVPAKRRFYQSIWFWLIFIFWFVSYTFYNH